MLKKRKTNVFVTIFSNLGERSFIASFSCLENKVIGLTFLLTLHASLTQVTKPN